MIVERWFEEPCRWRDANTGRFCGAPECYWCGKHLTGPEVDNSLCRDVDYTGCDWVDYDDREDVLLCWDCYRQEYGCDSCIWSEGNRFCTGVCDPDNANYDAEA